MSDLPPYAFGGARANVEMHDAEMRRFLEVWKEARAAGLALPATDDPNYASLDHLCAHVLRCARHYMLWMCEQLGYADPGIEEPPEPEAVTDDADAYLEHVLERWRTPLRALTEEQSERPEYASRWGPKYCIDAMLEHAVMHPYRHRFQLERLLRPTAT